jgi:hypothetical protein
MPDRIKAEAMNLAGAALFLLETFVKNQRRIADALERIAKVAENMPEI